jgi:hypothetical protein
MKSHAITQPSLVVTISLLALATVQGQTTVTVDPGTLNLGYMNVFNLPSAGGAYQFGSTWGIPDLTANFAGTTLTLGPNQINDPSSYWYTPAGGPGATGNKLMDASLYNETTGTYVGTTLTFNGDVLQNTLAGELAQGNGVAWSTVAFIKDFNSSYSASTSVTTALTPGMFSISLPTSANPGDHIQYGFETIGSDIWSTDVGNYGTVVIAPTPVPEPSAVALALLGGTALLPFLLRRRCGC